METLSFFDIPGIKVGHDQNFDAGTGCTVVICEDGASAGVDVRGGAPGTRETDLLDPSNLVEKIHAVVLAGGSAFGLDAASGVMELLEQRGIGFDVGVTRVPIVCSAVLFDLACGDWRTRPDRAMGRRAAENALDPSFNPECGSVGAGTGATVGKFHGMENAMRGGIGSCAFRSGNLKVGALVAVNCLGDVIDPNTGRIVAGAWDKQQRRFLETEQELIRSCEKRKDLFADNTTIGVVATNARLTKAQARKIASMAHDGLARTMRPAHTMADGDTIFALSTGDIEADINGIGALAARAVEGAVLDAVKKATAGYGYPAASLSS
ncbi:MAG: P1 family peptidase [Synergistaceae bacterium]|nr:P1 family peptidase [Synergistota bacterium]NLM71420.1 P1 family peptidase [Synergistaceae bacterium]